MEAPLRWPEAGGRRPETIVILGQMKFLDNWFRRSIACSDTVKCCVLTAEPAAPRNESIPAGVSDLERKHKFNKCSNAFPNAISSLTHSLLSSSNCVWLRIVFLFFFLHPLLLLLLLLFIRCVS